MSAPTIGMTPTRSAMRSPWAPALIGWVVARVIVAGSVAAASIMGPLAGREPPSNRLLVFDGTFYRGLADHGYAGNSHEAMRFFPLYPLLGRWLDVVLPGGSDVALLVLSNVLALVAAVVLWRVVVELSADAELASRSVLLFSLFPASASLVLAYSESLMVLLVMLAALTLAWGRPWVAAVPLFLAGLARPTGVLLVVPVAVLAVIEWRKLRVAGEPEERRAGFGWYASWAAALAAPVVGCLTFLAWLEVALDSGTEPLRLQREIRDGFAEPVTRVGRMVVDVATGHFHDVYNLGLTIVLIVAVVGAIRRRFSPAWTAYLIVGLLVALASNVVDSIGRYGVVLAPAWPVGLAAWCEDRRVYALFLAASAVGMAVLTTAWIRGYVIP